MMLAALDAGLTVDDMRHMKYTHLMLVLYEHEDMNGADTTEVRDATDKDIRMLMSL